MESELDAARFSLASLLVAGVAGAGIAIFEVETASPRAVAGPASAAARSFSRARPMKWKNRPTV